MLPNLENREDPKNYDSLLDQGKAFYYFKLFNNIANPIEPVFAKMEISGLFPGNIHPIRNFVDVLMYHPFRYFIEKGIRIQDIVMRDTCYGNIQGFYSIHELVDISSLIQRLAYTREIYVILRTTEKVNNTLQKLYPNGSTSTNVQIFSIPDEDLTLLRIITHMFFTEQLNNVVLCSAADNLKRAKERIIENIERLIEHIREGTYYIPRNPKTSLWKEFEDFVDERNEITLYLSHKFGPPYKAKFHPRMVRALCNFANKRKNSEEIVLDPMVGSGTMSIEATLMGIKSFGVDINPLDILVTKAKINSLFINPDAFLSQYLELCRYIDNWQRHGVGQTALFENEFTRIVIPQHVRERFAAKSAELTKLYLLKNLIRRKVSDERLKEIFFCALAKTISDVLRRRRSDSFMVFKEVVEEMWKMIFAFYVLKSKISIKLGSSENYVGDARFLSNIPSNSIDTIVTSPPYSTAVDYVKEDLAQLLILELVDINNLEKNMIGHPRPKSEEVDKLISLILTQDERFTNLPQEARELLNLFIKKGRKQLAARQLKFLLDMKAVLKQMARVLKEDGYCIVIIGNNNFEVEGKKIEFKNDAYLVDIAEKTKPRLILDEKLEREYTKTSFGAIRKESILIFRKESQND